MRIYLLKILSILFNPGTQLTISTLSRRLESDAVPNFPVYGSALVSPSLSAAGDDRKALGGALAGCALVHSCLYAMQ